MKSLGDEELISIGADDLDDSGLFDDEDEMGAFYGDVERVDGNHSDDSGGDGGAVPVQRGENADRISVWDDLDAHVFGDIKSIMGNNLRPNDEDISRSQNSVGSHVYAKARDLPISHRRRGRIGVDDGYLEELQEHELACYLAISNGLKDCFHENVTKKKQSFARNWTMTRQLEAGVSFDECCEVLNVRPNILLLRLHFQFFLKRTQFPEGFGFMTRELPREIEGEIAYYGDGALDVARRIWGHPGLAFEIVIFSEEELRATEKMIELGYFCDNGNALYVTGRNPLLSNDRRPWVKLF